LAARCPVSGCWPSCLQQCYKSTYLSKGTSTKQTNKRKTIRSENNESSSIGCAEKRQIDSRASGGSSLVSVLVSVSDRVIGFVVSGSQWFAARRQTCRLRRSFQALTMSRVVCRHQISTWHERICTQPRHFPSTASPGPLSAFVLFTNV